MLDLDFIRNNTKKVKKACEDKNLDGSIVDRFLDVDKKRSKLLSQTQDLRTKRNALVHELKTKPSQEQIKEGRELKDKLSKIEAELQKQEEEFKKLLRQIPNPPADDVKPGKNEDENEAVKNWGKKPTFSFEVKDHLQLGESLGIIDVKRAARLSGSRFGYLVGEGVLLEFALLQYGLGILLKEGFVPVLPPVLTKVSTFHKLGYSEHKGHLDYYLVNDTEKEIKNEEANYYLIGTAEHALVPMHEDEILELKHMPKRYVGFSPAFRREAGSWGKDTKGILRVHQFDKLEMVSFIEPQEGADKKEHEYLLSLEEKIVQGLGLPYQVVKMCSGDLGHPAARKYDIECWFPSQNRYRETHSCSTCTDYQSRALNIKYRNKDGKTDFVHVLNGTAIAMGRTITAILENYQQKDGSVKVPEVLRPYVGKEKILRIGG